MKNSAWYTKLWRKKLDNLLIKGDAGAAWANMHQMLDAHLPVGSVPAGAPVAAKSVVAKIASMAAYILPAAAMVGAVTWYTVKPSAKQKINTKPHKNHEYHLKADSSEAENVLVTDSTYNEDRLSADSAKMIGGDSLAALENPLNENGGSITENKIPNNTNGSAPEEASTAKNAALNKAEANGSSSVNATSGVSGDGTRRNPNSSNIGSSKKAGNVIASSVVKKRGNAETSAYSNKLTSGRSQSRWGSANRGNRNSNAGVNPAKSGFNNKGERSGATNNQHKVEIPKELSNYVSPSLNFNSLPQAEEAFSLFTSKDAGASMAGNNSLLLADDKPVTAANNNVNKPADSQSATAKPPKSKIPKEFSTPAFNFGLEGGLNLGNATGLYGGILADYAITNRLLIGAGLRFISGNKLKGSYTHPSFFRPDTAAGFAINEERKVSAVQLPLNLTYKLSNLISLKAGAVINFAGNPGSATYTLGPVGGFRDTLRRAASIDSAVNKSVLAGKVSFGFTGGVSLNFKNFSVDARYLALPPYKVNNPLGNYSGSYNPFQIGVTYWFRQGAKKAAVGK